MLRIVAKLRNVLCSSRTGEVTLLYFLREREKKRCETTQMGCKIAAFRSGAHGEKCLKHERKHRTGETTRALHCTTRRPQQAAFIPKPPTGDATWGCSLHLVGRCSGSTLCECNVHLDASYHVLCNNI